MIVVIKMTKVLDLLIWRVYDVVQWDVNKWRLLDNWLGELDWGFGGLIDSFTNFFNGHPMFLWENKDSGI